MKGGEKKPTQQEVREKKINTWEIKKNKLINFLLHEAEKS